MTVTIITAQNASEPKAAKMRLPRSEPENIFENSFRTLCVGVSDQANMPGLPGMIVAAITEAERTSENAAAKTLFVVSALKNMGLFLFLFHSSEPFR